MHAHTHKEGGAGSDACIFFEAEKLVPHPLDADVDDGESHRHGIRHGVGPLKEAAQGDEIGQSGGVSGIKSILN